jgi:hypothetical protein
MRFIRSLGPRFEARVLATLLPSLCLGLLLPAGAGAQTNVSAPAAQIHQQPGSRVSATFAVSDVTELGGNVRLTLHVRLANSGDTDLSSAKWTLRTASPVSPKKLETLPQVFLPAHSGAALDPQVTLSRAEYLSLQNHRLMFLTMELQGNDGKTGSRTIALRQTLTPTRER